MKLVFVFIFATFAAATLHGQSKKDQSDVEAVVEELRNAMIDADKAKLERIAANELSYGHSSGVIEDKAQFVESIVSGKSDFVTITLSDQTIGFAGNVALVRHRFAAETHNSGTPGKVTLHVLLVFQKQGKEWKLLARQAVRLP